MDDASITEDII